MNRLQDNVQLLRAILRRGRRWRLLRPALLLSGVGLLAFSTTFLLAVDWGGDTRPRAAAPPSAAPPPPLRLPDGLDVRLRGGALQRHQQRANAARPTGAGRPRLRDLRRSAPLERHGEPRLLLPQQPRRRDRLLAHGQARGAL